MRATCGCSRTIRDSTFLCVVCSAAVEKQLAELPALAADLDTTRTRTSRTGGRGIGIVVRGSDRPVPWDDRAARVANQLRAHLLAWSRSCVDWRVRPEGPVCWRCAHGSCVQLRLLVPPADTIGGLSRFLMAALPALRHRPEVVEFANETDAVVRRAEAVIDRPADLTFFGPCGSLDYWPGTDDPILCSARCPSDLYGAEDAEQVTCGTCGAEHDVTTLRAFLLTEAEDQLVTAADLSKFLSAYGEPLTAERIRQWASRALLVAHGHDRAGRPLYRVSEAVELLTRMTGRRRPA